MTDNAGLSDNVSTMTEVSGLRSPSKSRPLGEVKDNIICFDEDNQIQRPTTNSSREGRRRRTERYSFRRMKEMRESLRQAALINIVAAVNDEYEDTTTPKRSQSAVDPFTNTMAVLSNLVLNKDRTISIPKQQVFKEAPQKFSIKKPLFYKNSADEPSPDEDEDEIEQRRRSISLSRTRTAVGDTPPHAAKTENISISVPLHQISEESKEESPDKEWIDSPAKVRIARSWTPRRRFVSLNKRNDTRITTSIAKCDAVDIYESTDTFNGSYVTNCVPPQHRPNSSNDLSMYRAKSLPSIFPVKRRKSCALQDSPQILTNNEKVKVTAPFKPPVQKTVRENSIAADNPILSRNIQKLSLGSTINGGSKKSDSKPSSGGFTYPEEQTESLPTLQQVDPSMSLECRSLTMTSQMMGGSSVKNKRISTNTPAFKISEQVLTNERDVMREIDCQFEELQKRISRKILNWSDRKTGPPPSANQQDIVVSGYNVLGKDVGMKSSLSSAQSRGTNNSMRGLKRVKFVDEETSGYEDGRSIVSSSVFWDDNERAAIRAQGVANKMHEPVRPIKPMSTNELIRLKKRLMPGHYNMANKHARYNILDNNSIRISGMRSRRSTSTATSFTSSQSDRRSLVSETDLASFDGFAEFSANRELDATNRNSSKVPKSFGMSSFYPDSQSLYVGRGEYGVDETTDTEDEDGEDDDEDDMDDIRMGDESFRVLKAIDLGTLSGYQNRRFKKPSIKETATTQHYVKIKMK
ncbi:uncharacterized protein LOC110442824 [Mizuhopecten yessoensis]|uniref:Uncharacterized protein n=1 Tax=Mizuhopecten yessoensis TaxID=6573 RepID=A0A210PGD5_MIZYE|nr:uncharacterized protein LOC110442824 [Mizuhopecten yessoensis]XP_021342309.1 uncharacterized protein LOC110442824 [Mizuhopecten yessoensis]OWF35549.1 hypothetical protein KP79_PYT08404 [Mizuhopecten yessoensis]